MAWRKLVVLEGRISLSLLCSHTRMFRSRIGLRFFSRLCYSALLHSTLVIRKANTVSRTGALQPPPILVSVITRSRFSQSLPQDKILKVFKQTSLHKPNWIIDSRTFFCAYNHFSSIYTHARGPTRRLLKPNYVFFFTRALYFTELTAWSKRAAWASVLPSRLFHNFVYVCLPSYLQLCCMLSIVYS
jgi:hypothetical protein